MPDGEIVGELITGYEVAEGGAGYIVTMHLREGLKWSDGDEVTTEDIDFALNYVNKYEGLSDWGCAWGNAVSVTFVDDYTFQLELTGWYPNSAMGYVGYSASEWGGLYPSQHYKPWHIEFNENADAEAVAAGFQNWRDRIIWSLPYGGVQKDLERPTLQPWDHISSDNDVKSYVRNPYFLTVDQAGNQLPYVDEILVQVVDIETYHLKAASGEMDFGFAQTSLNNYTLYKEGEAAGNYKVSLVPSVLGSVAAFTVNALHPDPVKRQVLGDKRFRQALSVAIDREEINEVLYQGVAVPTFGLADPNAPYYDPAFERNAVYDVARANSLLDAVGMRARGADGYRLGPDGKPFQIIMEHSQGNAEIYFLVEEYWEDVGINTEIVYEALPLWRARRQDGLYDIMSEPADSTAELIAWRSRRGGISVLYFQPWANWLTATNDIADGIVTMESVLADNDGAFPGIEPPQWVKDQNAAGRKARFAEFRSPDYLSGAREFYEIAVDQCLMFGTVGWAPSPVIARSNLRNVPTSIPLELGGMQLNPRAWQLFFD
jgi:peptide/nickel transport system substrate-binding protein